MLDLREDLDSTAPSVRVRYGPCINYKAYRRVLLTYVRAERVLLLSPEANDGLVTFSYNYVRFILNNFITKGYYKRFIAKFRRFY